MAGSGNTPDYSAAENVPCRWDYPVKPAIAFAPLGSLTQVEARGIGAGAKPLTR